MASRNLPSVIFFDLDKTLARSKQSLERDMAKVFAELSTQTRVAVTSGGRREQLVEQVIEQLPPAANLSNIYLLPTSGGAMYTYEDGQLTCVYEENLTQEEADHIEEVIEQVLSETGIVDLSQPTFGDLIEQRGSQVTLSALGQDAPIEKKEAWDPDNSKKEQLRDALARALPNYDIKVGGSTSLDVTRPGVNKAYGIRKTAEYLHIPISDMLYVGDALYPGGNDEVVKQTGIATQSVRNPDATLAFIRTLLGKSPEAEAESIEETTPSETNPTQTNPTIADALPAAAPTGEAKDIETLLKFTFKGDLSTSPTDLTKYSKDTSLFVRKPSLVAYPKNAQDVSALVKAVTAIKKRDPKSSISVTARSAGTDMSGGPLTTSVVAVFTKYMNKVISVVADDPKDSAATKDSSGHFGGHAITEPGVYYRDFEKATLAQKVDGDGLILPSYPASRELCAMGGIVNNNSGGERTLKYGKTEDYIEEVEVVLSDGSLAYFKPLSPAELEEKKKLETFEGDIYRKMDKLLTQNAERIKNAKPKVSKNSAGYDLWNVIDEKTGTFNLSKLICGAQGTLALMTKAKLRLIRDEGNRAMLVLFVSDINTLPDIVHAVLPFNPESFESYDDNTFKLAVKFLFEMLSQMGLFRAARLGISFLPEVAMTFTGGIPKLVLMAEFSADTHAEAYKLAQEAQKAVQALQSKGIHIPSSIKANEHQSEKYWIVRRESFALLRKNIKGMYASPFIDDFVVPPDSYPQFLPELNALLAPYQKDFIYTIAGHIGNGNFHIIPLMDLNKPRSKQVILELAPKVYELVIKYGGTTTGEHNDGIIRTPYLAMLFGKEMVALFAETKQIFDPLNIFNPGKKVGGTFADIDRDMLRSS